MVNAHGYQYHQSCEFVAICEIINRKPMPVITLALSLCFQPEHSWITQCSCVITGEVNYFDLQICYSTWFVGVHNSHLHVGKFIEQRQKDFRYY